MVIINNYKETVFFIHGYVICYHYLFLDDLTHIDLTSIFYFNVYKYGIDQL